MELQLGVELSVELLTLAPRAHESSNSLQHRSPSHYTYANHTSRRQPQRHGGRTEIIFGFPSSFETLCFLGVLRGSVVGGHVDLPRGWRELESDPFSQESAEPPRPFAPTAPSRRAAGAGRSS